MEHSVNQIDSVVSLSAQEFDKRYFQTGTPVIHRGGALATPYCRHWSGDYLRGKLDGRKVKVNFCDDGIYDFNQKVIRKVEAPFSDALAYFSAEPDVSKSYYLQQESIPDTFPELVGDLETPPWILPTDIVHYTNLWMGGAGCVSPLHFDRSENFLVQVVGRKELTMFSPRDSKYLYPSAKEGGSHLSQVNPDSPDLGKFPLFALGKPLRIVLEPGDVLFIPPGWWHHVRSLDMCISINYWWRRFDVPEHGGAERIEMRDIVKIIALFVAAGRDVNHIVGDGEPLLVKAIRHRFANVVEALLSQGADANTVSAVYSPGTPALQIAVEHGSKEMVALLLRHGAQPGRNNQAALALARAKGSQELLALLEATPQLAA